MEEQRIRIDIISLTFIALNVSNNDCTCMYTYWMKAHRRGGGAAKKDEQGVVAHLPPPPPPPPTNVSSDPMGLKLQQEAKLSVCIS